MATHEAFTLNDISDHELILNNTKLELKDLENNILSSQKSSDEGDNKGNNKGNEQGTHKSNEHEKGNDENYNNKFLDELNRIFIQKNREYLNNLDQLGIKKDTVPSWSTITNKIKNFADLNKIDEKTLGNYLPLDDIPQENYSYIAENLKAILANHLQRNPGWRSVRHGGFSTGYDLHNIEWSDKVTDKELNEVKNIKQKKDINKELNEIFRKGKQSKEYLNLWIQMTLPGKSAQEQQTIFEKIFERIDFTLHDWKYHKQHPEVLDRNEYFNNDDKYNYILANKDYKLKEAYINYQIVKKSGLFNKDGNLNFDSQNFFEDFQKVKNFTSKENITPDLKITVDKEEKNLMDFISEIRKAALSLHIPENSLNGLSLRQVVEFFPKVQDYQQKMQEFDLSAQKRLDYSLTHPAVNFNPSGGYAPINHSPHAQAQGNLDEQRFKCTKGIEESFAKLLLDSKNPPTGEIRGLTSCWDFDFNYNTPEEIVLSGTWKQFKAEWKKFKKNALENREETAGAIGGMALAAGLTTMSVFHGNIWVSSLAFTGGLRLGNAIMQEAINTGKIGIEAFKWHTFQGEHRIQEFGKCFGRGLGWLDHDFNPVGAKKFFSGLAFDYAATVATFGLSKAFGGALTNLESIKGIGGVLKFGMEELILENFLVDIPMNILQTGTETFLGYGDGVITGQTALGNKEGNQQNGKYEAYNINSMLDAMSDATQQNLSFENLCQTFFSTVIYGGMLEGGGKGISKLKQHYQIKNINALEANTGEIKKKNEEIQNFMRDNGITMGNNGLMQNGKLLGENDTLISQIKGLTQEMQTLNSQQVNLLKAVKNNLRYSEDPKTRVIFSLDLYSPYNTPLNILETKKKIVEDKLKEAKSSGDIKKAEELGKLLEEYKKAEKILKGEDGETQDETPEQASSSDQESQTITAEAGKEQTNLKNGKSVQKIASLYGIEFAIADKLLTPEGQKARGKYKDKLITLAQEITDSTAPHELLHAVFDLVDTNTRKEILDAIKKDKNIENDIVAEERLADSFSEYFRTGNFEYQTKEKGLFNKIKDFFTKCVNFIRGIESNQEKVQKLFDDIISGDLKFEETSQGDGEPKWQKKDNDGKTGLIKTRVPLTEQNMKDILKRENISEDLYNERKTILYKNCPQNYQYLIDDLIIPIIKVFNGKTPNGAESIFTGDLRDCAAQNLEVINKLISLNASDLSKLCDILFSPNIQDNINYLGQLGIEFTTLDDILLHKGIIIRCDQKRIRDKIEILTTQGKFSANDLLVLEDIILWGNNENLQLLIEKSISSAEDLQLLEDIICRGDNTNLQLFIENGIILAKDLLLLKDIITTRNTEKIRANIETLKSHRITSAEDLQLLEDIICRGYNTNLQLFIENGITLAKDLLLLKDIITTRNTEKMRANIETLKSHGITSAKDLLLLKDIIASSYTEEIRYNIETLTSHGITSAEDLLLLKDIITSSYTEEIRYNIETLKSHGITSAEDLLLLKDIITSFYTENIRVNIETLTTYRITSAKDLSKGKKAILNKNIPPLPQSIKIKEQDPGGYLPYIEEILYSKYGDQQQGQIIEKILTLTFKEIPHYLNILKIFDDSPSQDIQKIKNELVDGILTTKNPEEISKKILNIFLENNLPLTGKIFKVFELLYPQKTFKKLLQDDGSPVLHQYLQDGNNIYQLIYKDLMNIAIKSGDRSLKHYLETFKEGESILKKFEESIRQNTFNENTLDSREKEQLCYLLKKVEVLYETYFSNEKLSNIDITKPGVTDQELKEYYHTLQTAFHLKKGKSLYTTLNNILGFSTDRTTLNAIDAILDEMKESKRQAHQRGIDLYNNAIETGTQKRILFPNQALVKGTKSQYFHTQIASGIVSKEYLGGESPGSDFTPFDADVRFCQGEFYNGGKQYGNIHLIINSDKPSIYHTEKHQHMFGNIENRYEIFHTKLNDNSSALQYGIRTGIPTTEVDYIIYTGEFDSKEFQDMCYEIAKNGYYLPITDKDGTIKFTPEMYHKLRKGFNYMTEYEGFDLQEHNGVYEVKDSPETINSPKNDPEFSALIEAHRPHNEKNRTIAEKNHELATKSIETIKKILTEKCCITFNSEFDHAITGAEIHDSGSTGRGTDIPTTDVDLDFTLILDTKDYEKVFQIANIIHQEIGSTESKDHGVEGGGYQIKSKKNNLGKEYGRENIPLDLLIMKKSQIIDYSSSDAMKEKLDEIGSRPETGADDLEFVKTNIIIMKKLLKAKGIYKKPEGGMSGIGVENRIIQNHGNFIEALESFENTAYGGKYEEGKSPLPLSEFQKKYPIFDAGQNYKDGVNDNFVYLIDKEKEGCYKGTLEIIATYRTEGLAGIKRIISDYETKKGKYIDE